MPKDNTRYAVLVDYEIGNEGWRMQHQRWEHSKSRALLAAAYLIGLVHSQNCYNIKVSIVDSHTDRDIHVPGDDLYWMY